MNEFIKITMPIIALIVGAFLGYLTNIINNTIVRRNSITTKLFEQYLNAKNEICEELSRLANLRTISEILEDNIDKTRNVISCLYFKHYDLLPKSVLLELNCLYFCLSDKNNNLYKINCDSEVEIINNKEDLEVFLATISMIPGFKHVAYYQIMNQDKGIKQAASINYQARKVLFEINRFFNLEFFMRIHKELRKI